MLSKSFDILYMLLLLKKILLKILKCLKKVIKMF